MKIQRVIKYSFYALLFLSNLFGFDFGDIPIQDGGRIKPLDSFARNHLLAFYGKGSLKMKRLVQQIG